MSESNNNNSNDDNNINTTSIQKEKNEKAKVNLLRMAPAGEPHAPPPASASASSLRSSKSSAPSLRSSKNSKRSKLSAKSSGSIQSRTERSPLRYSPDRKSKTNQVEEDEEGPWTPGAIRMGTDVEEAEASLSLTVEEAEAPLSLTAEEAEAPLSLTAEAVPAEHLDQIHKLETDNEALRQQVEHALQSEQKALQQVLVQTHPTANIVVAVEQGEAVAAAPEEKPPATTMEATEKACFQCCKTSVTAFGCCCIFCIMLGLIAAVVGAIFGIDANDSAPVIFSRRAFLETLLSKMEPLHPQAFGWLVDTDNWEPPLLDENNTKYEDLSWKDYLIQWLNDDDDYTSTAEERKDWMWVERYLLALLYYSTNGTDWVDNSGWLSNNSHCLDNTWYGISCQDDSIVSIDLGMYKSMDLIGLPFYYLLLPYIYILIVVAVVILLEINNLNGPLPTQMQALASLQSIKIGDSQLTGIIPPLPTSLTKCWLCK
jgi:hypothetical protein